MGNASTHAYMIGSALKRLPFWRNFTTSQWEGWWENRKIDWKAHYLDTWNHPHRFMISNLLKEFQWMSLLEVGCGAGANLVNILRHFPNKQLGGTDINPDAIKLAMETFKGALFKVCPAHDIIMSDSSTDVVLTDMTLIYSGPWKIKKTLKEIRRVARLYVVFSEFHSENPLERFWLRLTSGYHAHNYRKLLDELGFYDIMLVKVPADAWPGADARQKFRYLVVAKVPRRK